MTTKPMSEADKEQIILLNKYIKRKVDILDTIFYVECIQCQHVFKVDSKMSMSRRKFCDKCRAERNKNSFRRLVKNNEDIGW
jgi:hypothetical protein